MSQRNRKSTKNGQLPKKKGNNQNNNSSKSKKSNSVSRMDNAMRGGSLPQKSAAVAYASGQIGKAPIMKATRDSCRIVHRELISSVTGSVAFAVQSAFALNPGIATTFPWLASQAAGWEQYRFNKLRFCYFTRTGTGVPGSVLLAPDYDAADAAPLTEQVASSYEGVAEDAPWKDIVCDLPSKRLNGSMMRKNVRTSGLADNLDIKTYDAGNLFLCTIDGTAVPWGKLWVEYDVEFFIPQLPSTGAIGIYGGAIAGGSTMIPANPLGLVPVVDASASGISVDNASVITFQNAGTYLVSVYVTGTTLTACTLTAGSNSTVTQLFPFVSNVGTTVCAKTFMVVTTAISATAALTITGATIISSGVEIAIAPPNSLA